MKIRNSIILSVILLACSGAIFSYHRQVKNPATQTTGSKKIPETYAQLWMQVDSLEKKGLNQSALEITERIYQKAKSDSHAPQLVKAVIHRMKYQSYTEEDAVKKIISGLKTEISEAQFPVRPLLHSMLAETYWKYYQQNRYRFLNRTETVNYSKDDISTWDLKKILGETESEYALSLADEQRSMFAQVNIFDDVIEKGKPDEARKFRPSLFDFLAHRALDFYENDETGLTQPANRFEINNAFYMSTSDDFLNVMLKSDDTLSLQFQAIRLLQKLIAFHKRDGHPGAYIDVDIERLKFVYRHLTILNKDSLYMTALRAIDIRFVDYPGSTDAMFERASKYYEWGGRYSFGDKPEAKWLIKKAYSICGEAISRFPYSQGGLNCKYLKSQIEEKGMSFTVEQANVPNQPFLARLNYRNLDKIYFRIAKNDLDETNDYTELYGEKRIRHYMKLPSLMQWSSNMENEGDYQQHSVEVKIPELPLGNYVILSSSSPDFTVEKNAVAFATCWISNISYVSGKTESGGYDFYVLNRESGTPMSGVTARLYVQQYNYRTRKNEYIQLNTYRTDVDGFFTIPSVSDYRNFDIEFSKDNDRLFLNDNFYQYRYGKEEKKLRTQTFFFTDRSIYRPGQTIYFKGIMVETGDESNAVKTKQSTTVTFYDVNGQKIADQVFVTNEYGTFNGSFAAPVGLLNGTMRIASETGSAFVSVEEYKRPKFEVKFEPLTGTYRLNDKVTITGKAVSYAGAAIDQAQVQFRVVRTAIFPYWYGWRPIPSSSQMEIKNGIVTTNSGGEFTIVFDAIPDLSIPSSTDPVFNFKISADVTDINGETQSQSQTVSVSNKALLLSLNIPDQLNRETTREPVIGTHNLAGNFVPSRGIITISKLKEPSRLLRKRKWTKPEKQLFSKEEFEKNFPYDGFGDEDNPEKFETENRVLRVSFDTGIDSLLHLSTKEWKQGMYKLEAVSKDPYNEEVRFVKFFTVFSPEEKRAPVNAIDWFAVLKDHEEPGGTDQLLIGTHDKNVRVLYEIERKNEIISRKWLTMNDEQQLIEIPVIESYRGNIAVHFTFVRHNRDYHVDHVLSVPYSNKALDISFESFRNKLYPGQQEEWKIKIRSRNGEQVAAEMLATMYDASLDAFKQHSWLFDIYRAYYSTLNLSGGHSFGTVNSNLFSHDWNIFEKASFRTYDRLNWFGYEGGAGFYSFDLDGRSLGSHALNGELDVVAPMANRTEAVTVSKKGNAEQTVKYSPAKAIKDEIQEPPPTLDELSDDHQQLSLVKGRTNFNETAFFYPQLTTNDSGEVTISFAVPEALTRWKMMGFATTTDLKYGMIQKELITQKELMVVPDAPRFFREGDTIILKTKVVNLSDTSLSGTAKIFLTDAINMQPLSILKSGSEISFSAAKGQSATVEWKLIIPEGMGAISYKIVAASGKFSDGEEQAIPVLTNRMLVTETLPLPVRGKQNKSFEFEKLKNSRSSTLRNHKLTLEFTSNPAWFAIQALPYMMEFPYECSEQIFARYYANAIASHIASSNPKIKAVFDSWKSQSPEAFLSALEKNQDLKAVVLAETPWVADAKNETERKKRVALLFDLNKMSNELNGALIKLQKKQVPNGAWSWFEGMPDDRYITQYIVEGFGHLDHLGVTDIRSPKTWSMVTHAVQYLDARIKDDYDRLVELKEDLSKDHLTSIEIHYLYARSYFKDIPVTSASKTAVEYYKEQCQKFWLSNGEYEQGMIALALHRYDDKLIPADILKSLKENSQHNDELGMYWKNNTGGFYWMQAPVETQSLLIEAFDEAGNDQQSVDEMKLWLLKQKQTHDWKTTKATAEACYALLLRGTQWLENSITVEVSVGGKKIDASTVPDLKTEAGTGYFRTSWSGDEIKPGMANITVENKNEVAAWGAMYWQYFEQLDKITPHDTPLNLKKELFLEQPSPTGPVITPVNTQTKLLPGDRIKVRIELRVDRDMEYVMMKDMRAAGLEPEQVLSQYKWQDGLGYYESTRDASVNFFFSYIPKGTFVFEYPLRVSHEGNFSNGITDIQCMYAPEFAAHSEGIRVKVGN